jgi:thiol-disulfide isomerase/thioredoxin
MHYLTRPVSYLEDSDFNDKGNLTTIPPNKPVLILIQSLGCYHCTKSKPAFQELAIKHQDRLHCCTIQMDSPKMTPQFLKKIPFIYPDLVGFPSYILYYGGKKIVYDGNRSLRDLEQFVSRFL